MTTLPYRTHHLLQLLKDYDSQKLPLDVFISHYFREHKSLGSNDRAEITENIYGMIRWRALIDHLCDTPVTWESRLALWSETDLTKYQNDESIPFHIRSSTPKNLYDLFVANYGEELAKSLCFECNQPAPTYIRVNPLKISRDQLFDRWKTTYDISVCPKSTYGIRFHKKINFFGLPEFKEGLFEIQDEGSQLLADLVKAGPGDRVMDYCSGSGGKTLAFAPRMENKGQIYLHDIRPWILIEAKKRLRRAGIQNGQIINPDSSNLKALKKKMDWVLVDAPCSGTGTLRRNPDMKWNFNEQTIPELVGKQRMIFEKALSYVRPGGKIVYATCSLLNQENEEQVEYFLKTYPVTLSDEIFKTLPKKGSMDGFFGAVFTRM